MRAEDPRVARAEIGRGEGVGDEPDVSRVRRKQEGRGVVLDQRPADLAVHDQPEVVVVQRHPAEMARPRGQPVASEGQKVAVGHDGTAEVGVRPRPSLLERRERRASLFKKAPIAHREVAFGGKVVGDQDVVAVELDVPQGHFVERGAGDRRAVDEVHRRNQHLAEQVDANRMAGRDDQLPRRTVRPEGVRRDLDDLVLAWRRARGRGGRRGDRPTRPRAGRPNRSRPRRPPAGSRRERPRPECGSGFRRRSR